MNRIFIGCLCVFLLPLLVSHAVGQDPNQGPGGPILLIASSSNPFGRYYTEILRAEDLNLFAVADISSVTATTLAAHDICILGQIPLTSLGATWTSLAQSGPGG
jgi:hypothetical protein